MGDENVKNFIIQEEKSFYIDQSKEQPLQFPFLEVIDGKGYVTCSRHQDTVLCENCQDGYYLLKNDPVCWECHEAPTNFYLTSLLRTSDGNLFAMSYVTARVNDDTLHCYSWISRDEGLSWEKQEGTLQFEEKQSSFEGSSWGGFLFHRTMMQMEDGSLQGTMYGSYAADRSYRCLWVRSDNMGKDWKAVSSIAYDPEVGKEGFCEPVVVRCTDQSLLCVMRTGGNSSPLYQCRSRDNGKTWDSPVPIPCPDGSDCRSVDPDLCRMQDGTLVLSFGRPGCRLLFSEDGCGNQWGHCFEIGKEKVSGYTGVRELSPGQLLVIGDNGSDWMNPQEFGIWGLLLHLEHEKDADHYENY